MLRGSDGEHVIGQAWQCGPTQVQLGVGPLSYQDTAHEEGIYGTRNKLRTLPRQDMADTQLLHGLFYTNWAGSSRQGPLMWCCSGLTQDIQWCSRVFRGTSLKAPGML